MIMYIAEIILSDIEYSSAGPSRAFRVEPIVNRRTHTMTLEALGKFTVYQTIPKGLNGHAAIEMSIPCIAEISLEGFGKRHGFKYWLSRIHDEEICRPLILESLGNMAPEDLSLSATYAVRSLIVPSELPKMDKVL